MGEKMLTQPDNIKVKLVKAKYLNNDQIRY